MKVCVWTASGPGDRYITGVGQHMLEMTRGLGSRPGIETCLLVAADANMGPGDSGGAAFTGIPIRRMPLGRRLAQALWMTVGTPRVDRWVGDVDWVYCPRELLVPASGPRVAVTVHDLWELEEGNRYGTPAKRFRVRTHLRKVLAAASLILAVSEFTRRRVLEEFGPPPGRVVVVGNGIDPGYFGESDSASASAEGRAAKPYLLSVGGLTWKKGGDHVLALADALRKIGSRLEVRVLGPVEEGFRKRAAATPNLVLHPRGAGREEMQRVVRGASSLLVLSRYEGFGMPALEGMAAGVPVVAADRAALPEVVGDGAVVLDPEDAGGVAETVLRLSEDAEFRRTMIGRGRLRAAGSTWGRCVDRLVAAMEGCS